MTCIPILACAGYQRSSAAKIQAIAMPNANVTYSATRFVISWVTGLFNKIVKDLLRPSSCRGLCCLLHFIRAEKLSSCAPIFVV